MDSSLQRLQKMFEMGRQLGGELAPGQVIYVWLSLTVGKVKVESNLAANAQKHVT